MFVKQYTASRSTVIILLNIDTLIVISGYFRIVNNSNEERSERSAAENVRIKNSFVYEEFQNFQFPVYQKL